jgi:hypothetical protein
LAQDGGLWKSLTHRARLAWGRLGGLTHSQQTYADEDSNLIQKEK